MDGHAKTLLVFDDTNVRTPKYTFCHSSGILFATQLAQVALVVTENATFENMKHKGFAQKGCAFASHSLCPHIHCRRSTYPLVDVVFHRAITMQRDSENRSNYAICAVNPSRISPTPHFVKLSTASQSALVCFSRPSITMSRHVSSPSFSFSFLFWFVNQSP